MQWIKASERLPEIEGKYCIKIMNDQLSFRWLSKKINLNKFDPFEWLDESEPSLLITEVEQITKPTGEEIVTQIFPYIDEKLKESDLRRLYNCIDTAMEEYATLRSQPKNSGRGEFKKMDKELDLVHECLAELYSIDAAVPIIKKYLAKIEKL